MGSPMRDSILGPRKHDLSQRQTLNHGATQMPPIHTLNSETSGKGDLTGPVQEEYPPFIQSVWTRKQCVIYRTASKACPGGEVQEQARASLVGWADTVKGVH